jgi:glycosyltransferase involved in cell wall biosynthesis
MSPAPRTAPLPSLTLAITTHERPDALQAVLRSALAQRDPPDEVVVADDGSGSATAACIAACAHGAPFPVRHVRQPHEGFRLTRLRNLAIVAASGDYLVFIDGDMVLHREFVADHRALARRGHFTQGVRIPLDRAATAATLADPLRRIGATSPGLGGLRRAYAWHAPRLQPAISGIANRIIALKGCNQGFWRDDLVAVNGFEERIEGWGPEDKELCARLGFAGVHRQTLLFGGIAWHLEHPPAARDRRAANERVLAETLAMRRTRAERGLAGHAAAASPRAPGRRPPPGPVL